MSSRVQVVGALFRKELRSFLGNPSGYVFLTLFIVASAAAAFLTDSFFSRNLADLATLNRWMPAILMFFVPAITMGLWADERSTGTDELLLTLPVRDGEVVLGKFLGALGVYTVGLLFSLFPKHRGKKPLLRLVDSGELTHWLFDMNVTSSLESQIQAARDAPPLRLVPPNAFGK